MTASAQDLELNNNVVVTKCNYTVTNATSSVKPGLRLNEAGDEGVAGSYLFKTVTNYNTNMSSEVTVAEADGAYTVTGLVAGSTVALNATYADGVLTVPAGQVSYSHATYGDATLCVMVSSTSYNPSLDAQFTVGEDGKLTLSNGVGFIQMLSGTYDGYNLGYVYSGGYDMAPVNGTITNTLVNSDWSAATTPTTTYNTVVEYADGQGVVRGMEGYGWVNFTYDESNAVTFAQDSLYYYNSTYTDAYMALGGKTSSGTFGINSSKAPAGTIDFEAGTITINPWAMVMKNVSTSGTSILGGRKSQSVITFPVSVPTAITDVTVEKVSNARKYIQDGRMVIEKDGVKYNIAGQRVE